MTPALDLLKKARAEHRIHSYEHDPKAAGAAAIGGIDHHFLAGEEPASGDALAQAQARGKCLQNVRLPCLSLSKSI